MSSALPLSGFEPNTGSTNPTIKATPEKTKANTTTAGQTSSSMGRKFSHFNNAPSTNNNTLLYQTAAVVFLCAGILMAAGAVTCVVIIPMFALFTFPVAIGLLSTAAALGVGSAFFLSLGAGLAAKNF